MTRTLRLILASLSVLLCTACAQNTTNFPQLTGYDQEGLRTGSFLTAQGTLTPY